MKSDFNKNARRRKKADDKSADAQRGEAERRPEPEREQFASAKARQNCLRIR